MHAAAAFFRAPSFAPLAAFLLLTALWAVVVLGAGATAALCFFAGY